MLPATVCKCACYLHRVTQSVDADCQPSPDTVDTTEDVCLHAVVPATMTREVSTQKQSRSEPSNTACDVVDLTASVTVSYSADHNDNTNTNKTLN